ncbi:hypothetical protein BS47DRAFT_1000325 [Hydnum rufescens UP504]|uniref:Uncharacterized protein n=1 Tax=Hydnum rufescens UP504 TaxID=1448309 RepID=A0A9P6DZS9_9AGAM|nr:hypothetical protein BS47DRAFT_1000325 [Hydnum rufescens UP504]
MLRSTPAIVTILTLHGLASFFPREDHPHPGTITNVHLLKRRSLGIVFASFFSVPTSPLSLLLATYNTFVLFATVNPPALSLSKTKSQLRTVGIWCVIALAILYGRVSLGFAFSRGTGWAYPRFFFNDSIHEVSRGLSPIILYTISYLAYFSEGDARFPSTNFPFLPTALLLWLPNAFQGPIFFWSFPALSVSGSNY